MLSGSFRPLFAASVALGAFLHLSPAHAVPMLSLNATGAGSPVIVVDDGANDDPGTVFIPGIVSYTGSVGVFDINTTTGVTKPLIGSATSPIHDLNSINVNGAGPGTITLMFTETDYFTAGGVLDFSFGLGGVAADTIQFQAFASDANTAFGLDTLIVDSGVLSGSGSGTFFGSALLSGTYSLTTVVTITHSGIGQNTSFGATLTTIPAPGFGPVILAGLVAMGASRLRRRRLDA